MIKRQNRKLKESLEDETLTIPGLDEKITLEEAGGHEMSVDDFEVKESTTDTDYWRNEEKKDTNVYPIKDLNLTDENRIWLENAFKFLVSAFGNHDLKQYEVITSVKKIEQIPRKQEEQDLDLVQKLAAIIGLEPREVFTDYYGDGIAAPPYGWFDDDKLHISVYEPLRNNPSELITEATFQLAYVKLLTIKEERRATNC